MKKLIIKQTSTSPMVILDPDNERYEISGESRPEDVSDFFMPILNWLDEFGVDLDEKEGRDKAGQMEFNFNIDYFNSTSATFILDIVKKIGKIRSTGNDIMVKWHYEEDDEDMLEVGKEMSRLVKFPFEYFKL
jgi:hypothetical protein